jgi:hypothetical protein
MVLVRDRSAELVLVVPLLLACCLNSTDAPTTGPSALTTSRTYLSIPAPRITVTAAAAAARARARARHCHPHQHHQMKPRTRDHFIVSLVEGTPVGVIHS